MFRITLLPANDGDCLLVETESVLGSHRILIDGGRRSTVRTYLRPLIASLPARAGPEIDLVVLTHIDADHVEGLIDLLVCDTPPTIGEIWFNELQHFRMAQRGAPPTNAKPVPVKKGALADVLSVQQALALAAAIKHRGWGWNSAFGGGPVMAPDFGSLPRISLQSGAVLTLLGPTQTVLADFERYWDSELEKLGTEPTPSLGVRRRPVPRPGNLERLASLLNEPDRAKPNGTCIAFVLEHDGDRALFLADAHPDTTAHALHRYSQRRARIDFAAIKVAHHGSAANNTSELVDRLESKMWLISSDGSRHQHPDPEAIARLVLAPLPNKTLLFNYRTEFNEVWSDPNISRYYGYAVKYADAPISVDL